MGGHRVSSAWAAKLFAFFPRAPMAIFNPLPEQPVTFCARAAGVKQTMTIIK